MKRASQGGSSPYPKHPPFYELDSEEEDFNLLSKSESLSSDQGSFGFPSSSPATSSQSFPIASPSLPQALSDQSVEICARPGSPPTISQPSSASEEQLKSDISFSRSSSLDYDWAPYFPAEDESPDYSENLPTAKSLVDYLVEELGVSKAASAILENDG